MAVLHHHKTKKNYSTQRGREWCLRQASKSISALCDLDLWPPDPRLITVTSYSCPVCQLASTPVHSFSKKIVFRSLLSDERLTDAWTNERTCSGLVEAHNLVPNQHFRVCSRWPHPKIAPVVASVKKIMHLSRCICLRAGYSEKNWERIFVKFSTRQILSEETRT